VCPARFLGNVPSATTLDQEPKGSHMKKSIMAAAIALAGTGFLLPTQASAGIFSPSTGVAAADVSSGLITDVQYGRHRHGYRSPGHRRWHHRHSAYRGWKHRPHYGRVLGGIALGTLLAGSAYYAYAGAPPAPGLCWYWADRYEERGYWDYC
jgi:hypothetical protein